MSDAECAMCGAILKVGEEHDCPERGAWKRRALEMDDPEAKHDRVGRVKRSTVSSSAVTSTATTTSETAVGAPVVVTEASKATATLLDISEIRTDGTQMRSGLDRTHVERLREALESGAVLPPVIVFRSEGGVWVADGHHRLEASTLAGCTQIEAEVREGTQRDAMLYSVGANDGHGLPRSNVDKRRAVLALLRDAEWSQKGNRWVAEAAHVTHPFVGKVRAELETVTSSKPKPTTTVGKDGKSRRKPKARAKEAKPTPKPEPVAKPSPQAVPADHGDVKDPRQAEMFSGFPEAQSSSQVPQRVKPLNPWTVEKLVELAREHLTHDELVELRERIVVELAKAAALRCHAGTCMPHEEAHRECHC